MERYDYFQKNEAKKPWYYRVIEVPEDEKQLRLLQRMYISFFKVYTIRENIYKILDILNQSQLVNDVISQQKFTENILTSCFFGFSLYSLYRSKGIAKKIVAMGFILTLKNVVYDPVVFKMYFNSCAMDRGSQTGQEIRILYNFYFPDHPQYENYMKMIEEYNISRSVQKEIQFERENMFD